MGPLRIEKLQRTRAVEEFTRGQAELDRFLACHVLQAQQAHSSQTYGGMSGAKIVGFYSIIVGQVQHADAPECVVKDKRATNCDRVAAVLFRQPRGRGQSQAPFRRRRQGEPIRRACS